MLLTHTASGLTYFSIYRFVEFGEFKGNLYGTTYASIRYVIQSGRICLLTPHTQVSDLCVETLY